MQTEASIEKDFDDVRSILSGTRGGDRTASQQTVYAAALVGAMHEADQERLRKWVTDDGITTASEFNAALNELERLSLIDTSGGSVTLNEITAERPHQVADVVSML